MDDGTRPLLIERRRPFAEVADEDLLRRLVEILGRSRRVEADLVAHIAEVDERRLYAREAFPSMFAYCTGALHLSEGEAYLRIAVARASVRYPVILPMLGDGRLHLSGVALLAPYLTDGNRDALLRRAAHRSKRQTEELIAEIAPRKHVPAVMRRLPERPVSEPGPVSSAALSGPSGPSVPSTPSGMGTTVTLVSDGARDAAVALERPDGVEAGRSPNDSSSLVGPAEVPPAIVSPAILQPANLQPLVAQPLVAQPPLAQPPLAQPPLAQPPLAQPSIVPPPIVQAAVVRPAIVRPLSPGRYSVQFTASAGLHAKIERLRALMRARVPDGDLAAVIEAAVTEKLERLEARRFASAVHPRKDLSMTDTSPASRRIPSAIRRAVRERDGNRCRYVDRSGRRCDQRDRLEYHHRHPFGLGGDHRPENIRLLCRAHNAYVAEIDYGRKAMARFKRPRPLPPTSPDS
jgi:hypothetical protein